MWVIVSMENTCTYGVRKLGTIICVTKRQLHNYLVSREVSIGVSGCTHYITDITIVSTGFQHCTHLFFYQDGKLK